MRVLFGRCTSSGKRAVTARVCLLPESVMWLSKESVLMHCKSMAEEYRLGKKQCYSFSLQKVSLYPDLTLHSANCPPGSVLEIGEGSATNLGAAALTSCLDV